MTINYQYFKSPIGQLRLVSNGSSLTAIEFEHRQQGKPEGEPFADQVLEQCARQLDQYFSGQRRVFDLPLAAVGTDFQREVWGALRDIPYGTSCSYADIARVIGRPKAVRAVGTANGRNPLPVVVPCHRVVGKDGSLTGFAGGLELKRQLLELEGALPTGTLL